MENRFRSSFSGSKRFYNKSGTGIVNEYGYDVDNTGRKILVKTGEKNLFEEIQSHSEECKIDNILKRAQLGDMSGFRTETAAYADITETPKSMVEAKAQMAKVENLWNKLPAETKKKYNWSVEEFIANAGNEAWLENMGLKQKTMEAAPVLKAAETTVETPEVNKETKK